MDVEALRHENEELKRQVEELSAKLEDVSKQVSLKLFCLSVGGVAVFRPVFFHLLTVAPSLSIAIK